MGGQGKLKEAPRLYVGLFILSLAAQLLFWAQTKSFRNPREYVLEAAPTIAIARILSFGDSQFYYRAQGLNLQMAGDWTGNLTPLQHYDYARLAGWFDLLSTMDGQSQYTPVLAGYYYGASRDPEHVLHIIRYLHKLALGNPKYQWRWLAHGVYLARHRVRDEHLALDLARQLASLPVPEMPIWTRQLPAFLLADMGEYAAARDILLAILAQTPEIPPEEQSFMRKYIEERLGLPLPEN